MIGIASLITIAFVCVSRFLKYSRSPIDSYPAMGVARPPRMCFCVDDARDDVKAKGVNTAFMTEAEITSYWWKMHMRNVEKTEAARFFFAPGTDPVSVVDAQCRNP